MANDLGCEIHFVVRGADAWAELHDQILRLGAKMVGHLFDGSPGNPQLSAFLSRMHQADRGRLGIDNVNGTTICDMDSEKNAWLIRDQAVGPLKLFFRIWHNIDNCNLITMDLLDCDAWPVAQTDLAPDFPIGPLQSVQGFSLIRCDIDAWNPCNKSAATNASGIQGRKMLDRLSGGHAAKFASGSSEFKKLNLASQWSDDSEAAY